MLYWINQGFQSEHIHSLEGHYTIVIVLHFLDISLTIIRQPLEYTLQISSWRTVLWVSIKSTIHIPYGKDKELCEYHTPQTHCSSTEHHQTNPSP